MPVNNTYAWVTYATVKEWHRLQRSFERGHFMNQASATAERRVSGISRLDERGVKFQRRTILAITIIPFAGFIAALVATWGWGVSPVDLGIFAFFYVLTGLGVTVGYHRLFTHRSFEAPPLLRAALAIAGSLAIEGSVISWVANHRRHHAYADKDGDPHSPHLDEGEGIGGIIRGLWHAHMGWLFDEEKTDLPRWAPDLLKEQRIVKIDRGFPMIVIATLLLPGLIGFALTQSPVGALTAFLWGSLVRVFMLHHITWSINSICHFYGKRPFVTTDYSTNNWVLSLISFGESWHNNHHAFPTSAVHGLGRWQFDPSAVVIRTLERLGLARNVKRASSKLLAAKRRA
jgi:stearoyl-CoA desaturase (delta-9 desaturase)